jgi:nucleoside-diphosphate-sugar epimerase
MPAVSLLERVTANATAPYEVIGTSCFWSFVHLDDAAGATVLALERGAPGIYNVVDDDPARSAAAVGG